VVRNGEKERFQPRKPIEGGTHVGITGYARAAADDDGEDWVLSVLTRNGK